MRTLVFTETNLPTQCKTMAHLSDLSTLVVPPNEKDAVRIPHFQRQQQQERLHRVEAPVDEVPHEEIVRVWAVPSHFEQLLQVVELTMDVP